MCYRFKKDVPLKSHKNIIQLSNEWNFLSAAQQKEMISDRSGEGFKRPSLLRHWDKFDMVTGFCLDVMHQMDEGVSRFFIKEIVEGSSAVTLTKAQFKEIDRKWLAIRVPGHENRTLRSLRFFKQMKAHELRFFLQHGAPYVTKDIVPKKFHRILCLASVVAWTSTKDSVSVADIKNVEKWCTKFLAKFQEFFGVKYMKFSVHLMRHISLALRQFGPLHLVSCYRPENEIGKIARRICGTNNTTKQIMNSFMALTQCSNFMDDIIAPESRKHPLVVKTAMQVLGVPMPVFSFNAGTGTCRLLGKPEKLTNEEILQLMDLQPTESSDIYAFQKAKVEINIAIRTSSHSKNSVRNENFIQDSNLDCWRIIGILGVLDREKTKVSRTLLFAEKLDKAGDGWKLDHVFTVVSTNKKQLFPTKLVMKQLVILQETIVPGTSEDRLLIVSPPSNIYLTT